MKVFIFAAAFAVIQLIPDVAAVVPNPPTGAPLAIANEAPSTEALTKGQVEVGDPKEIVGVPAGKIVFLQSQQQNEFLASRVTARQL